MPARIAILVSQEFAIYWQLGQDESESGNTFAHARQKSAKEWFFREAAANKRPKNRRSLRPAPQQTTGNSIEWPLISVLPIRFPVPA